jgi:hypothetical protein
MFSIAQVYVGVSFAGSNTQPQRAMATQDVGTLVTSGNQPILVNGNNALTDATILSGTSIETPQGVSATINLGRLGRLDVAPATSLRLEFSVGKIRVTLLKGCVILLTRINTTGTVETPKGVAITDPTKDDVIDVCQSDKPATPVFNQGAAADAGAGAGSGSSAGTGAGTASAGTASAEGLSQTAGVLIGGFGMGAMIVAVLVVPCDRSINPSPALGSTQCR